jgi:hypothetical protein
MKEGRKLLISSLPLQDKYQFIRRRKRIDRTIHKPIREKSVRVRKENNVSKALFFS